jgi:hypothetical protein
MATQAMRRSEAAKKAWRTRRRMAKVTPTMRRVLDVLSRFPGLRLSMTLMGAWRCHLHWTQLNGDGTTGPITSHAPRRVSYGTLRAMVKRGWLEQAGRRCTGTWTTDDRTQAIWELDHVITAKGRKALAS